MRIEIWSDIICPWCYIGKRNFETALEAFPHKDQVQIIWRSFELDPDSPRLLPGTQEERLAEKYDVSLDDAAMMIARVTAAAKEVGLEYRLYLARTGNTLDAHRLLHHAIAKGHGSKATERLMHAYFCEALPVGDQSALAQLAPQFGIPTEAALQVLQGNDYTDSVRADEARATQLAITSVPYFVFNESIHISGAQPVASYAAALQQAMSGNSSRQ